MRKSLKPPTSAQSLEAQLTAAWPHYQWSDVSVVVGVSGGADSVALLLALANLRHAHQRHATVPDVHPGTDSQVGRLFAAHCNHGLRGADSDADEQFVVALCQRLQIPCDVGRCDVSTAPSGDGLEADCRAARYAFLSQTAERRGARYLAIAHTADDQAETVLHHVLRGTGLAGLSGMTFARPLTPAVTLIRPLLAVRRAAVREYLRSRDQPWREDATNADPRYTRNQLRNQLLPTIAQQLAVDPCEALVRLSEQARGVQQIIEDAAASLIEQALLPSNSDAPKQVRIDCRVLARATEHLQREAFVFLWRQQQWPRQSMGFNEWQRLAAATRDAVQPPFVLPGNIQARRAGQELQLQRLPAQS